MNAINTTVTETDRLDAKRKRKSPGHYAQEILHSLQHSAVYYTTFLHQIPNESKKEVEAELKKSFELWANTWIAPHCREILAKEGK